MGFDVYFFVILVDDDFEVFFLRLGGFDSSCHCKVMIGDRFFVDGSTILHNPSNITALFLIGNLLNL